MDFLTIQTSAGPLGFVGRIHTDRRRPALLAVNGSFPPKTYLHDLIDDFAGANVLIANLPGMLGVPWSSANAAELTRGLEEAVRLLLGDLPLVAFGASTGNLLSFGLRLPTICRRVALEPFFQTENLWPFIAHCRDRMARKPGAEGLARFLWTFFGIGPDSLENRDYRHLLDGITVKTDVLVGGLPLLPEREVDNWPSFCSAEDRELLHANPLVTVHSGPPGVGHRFGSLPPSDAYVRRVLHAALLDAAQLCHTDL
jgi:hypothetical protein